jgi:hypothetical protein
MRYARALIPTLEEAPEATSPSRELLLRAGSARQVRVGMYRYLPPSDCGHVFELWSDLSAKLHPARQHE